MCHKCEGRGWGLKNLEPMKKGQFVIEYVGEFIKVVGRVIWKSIKRLKPFGFEMDYERCLTRECLMNVG